MPQWLDYAIHSGLATLVIVACVKVIARLNRDEFLKADYPPHRHVNGHIIYPHDYEPGELGSIKGH